MAIYNLTHENIGSKTGKEIKKLPPQIHARIADLVANQHIEPTVKASKVIALLKAAKVSRIGSMNHRFYVGKIKTLYSSNRFSSYLTINGYVTIRTLD